MIESEAYSELSQTSKAELFVKIVNSFNKITIFMRNSILEIFDRQESEYASAIYIYIHIIYIYIYIIIIVFMQPLFPKTRTHFLSQYNIARNEKSFEVLLFYYIQKRNKLSVKVPFFRSLFDDNSDMLYLEHSQKQ